MSYKPKYCCQCGEKIERINWKVRHSRRFCELCQTDYGIYDWMPHLTGIGILLTVFVINFYFQKTEKPLEIAPNQLMSRVSGNRNTADNQNAGTQVLNSNAVQTTAQTFSEPAALKTKVKTPEINTKPAESSAAEPSEKVYFCGAATKKGTPCSRRVRGGGRCWQHSGQTALVAQDKLLAVQ